MLVTPWSDIKGEQIYNISAAGGALREQKSE